MKTAQDYMDKYSGGEARGGFNSRLQGLTNAETCGGYIGSRWAERNGGWELADGMIKAGKIFSEIRLENGKRLEYKCMPDGNAWCCISPEFENLQESDCYTFADTREEAIIKFIDKSNPNKG